MSQIRAFISSLVDFLDDILLSFPEVLDIRTAYNQLKTWEDDATVKLTTTKSFMICCGPFYKEIFNQKEEFFTDVGLLKETVQKSDAFEKFGGASETEQENNLIKMLQLKDLWEQLTPTSKKRMWSHLKGLLVKGANALKRCDPNYENYEGKYDEILIYVKNNPQLYR